MINSPTVATQSQEQALGWMLVCIHMWVFEFKVITPSGLSQSGQGEAAHPDLLTHYHITPLRVTHPSPFFPLTFLSPSLFYSFSFNLLPSHQIFEVTFSLANPDHAYQFSWGLEVFASPPH